MTRRITVVTAGTSRPSTTRLLADRIADAVTVAVTARGDTVEIDVLEVRELAGDLATMATTGIPTPALAQARERVSRADGLVAVTPVFTASYSGLFKMFVDALDTDALREMPTVVAATAGTPRHSLVLDHAMRPLLSFLGALIVPTGVFAATADFGDAGDGSGLADRIRRAADELAGLLVAHRAAVDGSAPGDRTRPRRDGNTVPAEASTFEALVRTHLAGGTTATGAGRTRT